MTKIYSIWSPLALVMASTWRRKALQALLFSAAEKEAMFRLTEYFRVFRLLWGFLLTFLLSSDHN